MHKYIKPFLVLTLISIISLSCKQAVKMEEGVNSYGEDFQVSEVTSFTDLITRLETEEEIQATVKAKVESVCKVKGCWMNIVSTNPEEEGSFFVKFKDYGFFVPVDMGPEEVYITGKAFKEITTVEELRHYAEDEGKSEEEINKITEPEVQLKFMATGVKVI